MNITDIKIRRIYSEGRLRALVSITIDYDFAIHDIKIIEGPQRLFVAMPSRKDETGMFRDIVHPISAEARRTVEDAVFSAYEQYRAEHDTISGGSSRSVDADDAADIKYDPPQTPSDELQ